VKNNILVSDIIKAATEGKADCQPREWKTIEGGTRRVIYLYGSYDIYPLAEGTKLSSAAAQLQLPVETYFITGASEAVLAGLPANVQQEIQAMLAAAEQGNGETHTNLNTLVQQEEDLLQNSGIAESKTALKSKFDNLKLQMNAKRQELAAKRQAYEVACKKFADHLSSEQRIEIATQSDLERNRSQDVIKAELMKECVTQFRTTVKSLYSQEKAIVKNFQLVESSSQSLVKQIRLQAAKVLGIYLSSSEGDIKYTASVVFRFGFDYTKSALTPTNNAVIEWVFIRGGSFDMGDTFGDGSAEEKPVHRVTVKDFYLSATEVTVGQFRRFAEATGYRSDAEKEGWGYASKGTLLWKVDGASWRKPGFDQNSDHPVVEVSWNDAKAFCQWAGCRLPTEAEWEYAARNKGQRIKYSWGSADPTGRNGGNLADESAQRKFPDRTISEGFDDGYIFTAPVASYNPNELGLYDMSGNVWEWCSDWYGESYYQGSPINNPQGSSSGTFRVLRGGSWSDAPRGLRCSLRGWYNPDERYYFLGFRCARTP